MHQLCVWTKQIDKGFMKMNWFTHIDTVHQVEELLDTVLSVPSLSTLNLLATVLEMLSRFSTFRFLAFLSNSRCGLFTSVLNHSQLQKQMR